MPFYGAVMMAAFSISIAMLGIYGQYASYQGSVSSLISSYAVASRLETFSSAINLYAPNAVGNSTAFNYTAKSLAEIDGFKINELNGTFVVQTNGVNPAEYMVISS